MRLPSAPGPPHKSASGRLGQLRFAGTGRAWDRGGFEDATERGTNALARGARSEEESSTDLEPFLAEVGARIRSTRKRLKLKQSQLAAAIGTGASYIVQIEAGETNMTLRMLVRLAAALSVSPRDLLPLEHADQVAELLDTTMQDIDRAAGRLRQARTLVLTRPDASKPTIPSKD